LASIVMLSVRPGIAQGRVRKQATSLRSAGYDVTVFSLTPVGLPTEEMLVCEGVTYRAVCAPSLVPQRSDRVSLDGPVRRTARTLLARSGLFSTSRRLRAWMRTRRLERRVVGQAVLLKPEIVHHRDLPTLRTALSIARRCGSALVTDYPELPGHESDRSAPRAAREQRTADRRMRRHYGVSTLRFTVSQGIADHLAREFGQEPPIVLYNSPVIESQRAADSLLRNDCGIGPEVPLVVYVGDVASGRGVETLLAAVGRLNDLHLAVVGANIRRAKKFGFEDAVRRAGLTSRVHSLPAQPPECLLSYLAEATVGAFLLEDTCLNHRWTGPNKFFEMLLAGIPLVVSDLSVMGEVVQQYEVGIALPGTSPEEAAEALRTVIDEPSRFRPSAAALVALREKYGWEAQARTLVDAYQRAFA